jgi:hypothetical protein
MGFVKENSRFIRNVYISNQTEGEGSKWLEE